MIFLIYLVCGPLENSDKLNGDWKMPATVLHIVKELMQSGIRFWIYRYLPDSVVKIISKIIQQTKRDFTLNSTNHGRFFLNLVTILLVLEKSV